MELIDKIRAVRDGSLDLCELTDAEVDEAVGRGYIEFRRLTPREAFRLMDVRDSEIDRIQASGVSQTAQYKLAGNSIVVSCLYHIMRGIFAPEEKRDKDTLF